MPLREYLSSQPRAVIVLWASLLVLLLLCVEYTMPWEVSMFIFYAVPIFMVSWFCGARAGFIAAILCGVVSWLVNLWHGPELATYAWRGLNRLASFLFVAACGMLIRRERDNFQTQLEAIERTRELERDIVQISEREQLRIGQDLHDGLCQTIAAIDCAAECIRTNLEARAVPEAVEFAQFQTLIKSASKEARGLARGISLVQMDVAGFTPALEDLVAMLNRNMHTPIVLEVKGEVGVENATVAMHLYRIAQESLSNAMRHSGASQIWVTLSRDAIFLTMTIRDDGCGFDQADSNSGGMGLRTIRYRGGLIGAAMKITSAIGTGTTVRCSLPISKTCAAESPSSAAGVTA